MKQPITSITICMGSSCFSRGNNRNIEIIQDFLSQGGLVSPPELAGHHCEGHCTQGPNIAINGKVHHAVSPVAVTGLLLQYRQGV